MEIRIVLNPIEGKVGVFTLSIYVDGKHIGNVRGSYNGGAQINLNELHRICEPGTNLSRNIVSLGKTHIESYVANHPEFYR